MNILLKISARELNGIQIGPRRRLVMDTSGKNRLCWTCMGFFWLKIYFEEAEESQ